MDLFKILYYEIVVYYISFGGGEPSYLESCSIMTSSTVLTIPNSYNAEFSIFFLIKDTKTGLFRYICTNVYLYEFYSECKNTEEGIKGCSRIYP